MTKSYLRQLLWLLFMNFYISAFTFGGGYVVIPMVRRHFTQGNQLFSEEELTDMAAISQTCPGAIAVNLCVLAGRRCCGIPGALVSALGSILPPLIILSAVTVFYDAFRSNLYIAAALQGMEAGAAALVIGVVADLLAGVLKEGSKLSTCAVPVTFAGVFFFHLNPLWIILPAAAAAFPAAVLWGREDKEDSFRG